MGRRARAMAAGAAVAALLAGCGASGTDAADGGAVPPATDACGDVEFPPVQFGSHLLGDNEPPVPYSSTPATSGWHTAGAVPTGIHTAEDPLSEPAQVAVLEAGGVVVTHRGLPPAEEAALHEAAAQHPDRVVVTAFDGLERGEVAFTSWGALQRCDGLDLAALQAYVMAYGDRIEGHD